VQAALRAWLQETIAQLAEEQKTSVPN
jgi:hypothetical protein